MIFEICDIVYDSIIYGIIIIIIYYYDIIIKH